jgi:hypothetical protein
LNLNKMALPQDVSGDPNVAENVGRSYVWNLLPEGFPRKGLTVSIVVHFALFALLLAWGGSPQNAPIPHRAVVQVIARMFLPALPSSNPAPRTFDSLSRTPNPVREKAPHDAVPIDLSAIQLSFSDDVSNQLPDVVAAQGGVLALLDKESPTIARYILRPPIWKTEEATGDVTGKLRVLMDPPRKWPASRDAAAREGLNLDSFQACAMFDISYRQCLQSAIRVRVPPTFRGHVVAARLAFNASSSCGVEVLDISLSAAPQKSPAN